MQSERDEIIESIRQRLRDHRDHLLRRLGGQWPDESDLRQAITEISADVPALQELERTETALRKIREGSFGVCVQCDGEIAGERLEVVPFARVCVRCQLNSVRQNPELN